MDAGCPIFRSLLCSNMNNEFKKCICAVFEKYVDVPEAFSDGDGVNREGEAPVIEVMLFCCPLADSC